METAELIAGVFYSHEELVMATAALIPVSEYLTQMYHPDCDYLDGELRERNVGEQPHSELQAILTRIFGQHKKDWSVRVLTEQRVQITPTRYRIPNICVLSRTDPKDRIVNWAPILCIEVLSEEDRMSDVLTKVEEFCSLGVQNVWVLDPWKRVAYYASPRGFQQPTDGALRVAGTLIEISLAEIFAELDEF